MRSAESRPRKGLRAWGMGCGLMAAVPFLFLVIVTGRTCAPLQSAGEDRAELLKRYGPADRFTPTADGAIPPDRIERFLQVRRSLAGICEKFGEMQGSMQQVEELSGREDATGGEIAGTTGGMAKVAASITPLIGDFFEQRNRALVETEMGFGEYAYIFVLAYREQLLDESGPRGIFTAGGKIRPEVGDAIRSMIARQLEDPDRPAGDEEARLLLRREMNALESDPGHVPFPEELPAAPAASLDPYRKELDDAFCPVLAEIELDLDAGPAILDALY